MGRRDWRKESDWKGSITKGVSKSTGIPAGKKGTRQKRERKTARGHDETNSSRGGGPRRM